MNAVGEAVDRIIADLLREKNTRINVLEEALRECVEAIESDCQMNQLKRRGIEYADDVEIVKRGLPLLLDKDYIRGEPLPVVKPKPLPELEIGQRYRIKVPGITKPFVGIVTARYGLNWFMQTDNDGPHSFTPAQLVGAGIERLEREAMPVAS